MAATLEDIRVKNRQLAASNLAQQGAMAEARNQLAVVRSSEYQVRPCVPRWRVAVLSSHPVCPATSTPPPRIRPLPHAIRSSAARAQVIRARFDELLARQAAVAKLLGGARFRERLEDAVSEADAASSAVSTAFLTGQLPLDQFVEQYVELRSRHHALDLKRQAAEHILQGS